jgi:hypothetical protein
MRARVLLKKPAPPARPRAPLLAAAASARRATRSWLMGAAPPASAAPAPAAYVAPAASPAGACERSPRRGPAASLSASGPSGAGPSPGAPPRLKRAATSARRQAARGGTCARGGGARCRAALARGEPGGGGVGWSVGRGGAGYGAATPQRGAWAPRGTGPSAAPRRRQRLVAVPRPHLLSESTSSWLWLPTPTILWRVTPVGVLDWMIKSVTRGG